MTMLMETAVGNCRAFENKGFHPLKGWNPCLCSLVAAHIKPPLLFRRLLIHAGKNESLISLHAVLA